MLTVPSERRWVRHCRSTERVAQRLGARRGSPDFGALEIALHGRDAQFLVGLFVVLEFHPGLGGHVEQLEGELLDALEHGHQSRFDLCPERFLLAVLVRTFRQGRVVHDGELFEALHGLRGQHRRAVVTHESARQGALLNRLG